MEELRVAVVGTGDQTEERSASTGFAMGWGHANALEGIQNCRLVGCADIEIENAKAFASEFDISDDAVFTDAGSMVSAVNPDLVTVAVPPDAHAQVVIDCARSGAGAIHCEKPMAATWGGAQRMATACWRRDVQLTFNHQRRFAAPVQRAAELITDGAIGELKEVTFTWGDFFDKGAHSVAICSELVDDCPAEWVLAGLDYREENVRFGLHTENQIVAAWQYENGVYGRAMTGPGADVTRSPWTARGTEGELAIHIDDDYLLDIRRAGEQNWSTETFEDESLTQKALADAIDAYRSGREPVGSARRALNGAEILFAGYESVRQRGRVDLPLDIQDHPLESMVADGLLDPSPRTTDESSE